MGVEIDYDRSYPATINHEQQVEKAVGVAHSVVGHELVNPNMSPEMGAEDFSYLVRARPGAFLFLGQGKGPSLHNPAFDFNDDAAPIGASFFVRLIETLQPLAK